MGVRRTRQLVAENGTFPAVGSILFPSFVWQTGRFSCVAVLDTRLFVDRPHLQVLRKSWKVHTCLAVCTIPSASALLGPSVTYLTADYRIGGLCVSVLSHLQCSARNRSSCCLSISIVGAAVVAPAVYRAHRCTLFRLAARLTSSQGVARLAQQRRPEARHQPSHVNRAACGAAADVEPILVRRLRRDQAPGPLLACCVSVGCLRSIFSGERRPAAMTACTFFSLTRRENMFFSSHCLLTLQIFCPQLHCDL